MNQQSSIEFELAQSAEGSVPVSKGASDVDATVVASSNDDLERGPAAAGEEADDQRSAKPDAENVSAAEIVPTGSSATDVSQAPSERNALADKPLLPDEHNTVISTQLHPHDEPIPAHLQVSAEDLQARLFGSQENSPSAQSSLRIGDMDVYEKIGAGGMGAVFRAVDTELSREVALKVLHPRVSEDPALVARFRNEARACAQLNHDNIARVFSAGDHGGVHYIAYEYAAGRTIKELIHERGQLSTAETVNYAIQATLALGHIESAGIIHRDIKPSNIILTHSGRIKVVDLGLARRETEDSIADLTVAGTTLGTFDYLAPEQARDARAADIRSDIYSLGCSVYHMLTGCPPYPDGTAVQKMLDHQGKEPPDIREKNKKVPKALAEIVQRMMMTQVEERYQAPGQLLADLIHLATEMGLRSVPAEGIVWRRVPVTKVRDLSGNLFLAGAIVMICATALVMHFMPVAQEADNQLGAIQSWLMDPSEQELTPEGKTDQIPRSDAQTGLPNEPDNASGVSVESTEQAATPTATTESTDVAVQDDVAEQFHILRSGGTKESFTSLREAWDEARDGDVIELDFDGPAATLTSPLPPRSVQGAPRIELRAARGKQPVIVFAVDADSATSTSQSRRFFDLSSDLQLHIRGIHFQIDLTEAPSEDSWNLFDFRGTNRVWMKSCTIAVANPQKTPLTIFRLRDGGSIDAEPGLASVELNNCAIRGACDLVRLQAQVESSLVARECGFALDGCIVRNVGSAEMLSQGQLDLTLDHCTTIAAQPIIGMQDSDVINDSQPDRVLPMVQVNSRSSVFALLGEDRTLIEIRGNSYREELQELLAWDGVNNYYSNAVRVFLRVESGLSESDLVEREFDAWQTEWNRKRDTQETRPQTFSSDVWNSPTLVVNGSADSLSLFPISAFELNSAFFSASGGGQFTLEKSEQLPGVSAYDLPAFPDVVQPVAVRKPAAESDVESDE